MTEPRDLVLWKSLPEKDKKSERSRLHAFLFLNTDHCEKAGLNPLPLGRLNLRDRDDLKGLLER